MINVLGFFKFNKQILAVVNLVFKVQRVKMRL